MIFFDQFQILLFLIAIAKMWLGRAFCTLARLRLLFALKFRVRRQLVIRLSCKSLKKINKNLFSNPAQQDFGKRAPMRTKHKINKKVN